MRAFGVAFDSPADWRVKMDDRQHNRVTLGFLEYTALFAISVSSFWCAAYLGSIAKEVERIGQVIAPESAVEGSVK